MLNRYVFEGPFSDLPLAEIDDPWIKIGTYNVHTAFVTDNDSHLEKFPQYAWEFRSKAMMEFLKGIQPEILACEFNLEQSETFKNHFSDHTLVAFSSEMSLSLDEIKKLSHRAISQRKRGLEVKDPYYGEFVGFLIDSRLFTITSTKCHELPMGTRHKRILVELNVIHNKTGKKFSLFNSHLDHLSTESRIESGAMELKLVRERNQKGESCISFGDRNWFLDAAGQECYEAYIHSGILKDVRDNETKHYGPIGTFPGHLDLPDRFAPEIIKDGESEMIKAHTLDLIFATKEIRVLYSYTDYVAFDAKTGKHISEELIKDLKKKNFASDHYYLGAIVSV